MTFALRDHVGQTLLLDVGPVVEVQTQGYGRKRVVEVPRLVVVEDGTYFEDVLLWQAAVVAQLQPLCGEIVMVGVGTYEAKYGGTGVKLVSP